MYEVQVTADPAPLNLLVIKMVIIETLKYTIIKNREQYDHYCDILEELVFQENANKQDEIDLLTLLIEKWDAEHTTMNDANPIEILKYLMAEKELKSKDLMDILELSKGTISKILNYNKGLSKDSIRKISDYFKVTQETFNRPYKLINDEKKHFQYFSSRNAKQNRIEVR